MAEYTKDNRMEIPDPTPVELPIGVTLPESLEQMMARMIRVESLKAQQEGKETFEEADDFGEDEEEFVSEHQMTDMQEEALYVPRREQSKSRRRDDKENSENVPAEPVVKDKEQGKETARDSKEEKGEEQ